MVPVERPKANEKFASPEKIRKWKTGIKALISFAYIVGNMASNLKHQLKSNCQLFTIVILCFSTSRCLDQRIKFSRQSINFERYTKKI